MSESFRKYKVIETKGMPAEELQNLLSSATDGFPEMQIEHVVGTKIILGYESMLNAKGRADARASILAKTLNKEIGETMGKNIFSMGC